MNAINLRPDVSSSSRTTDVAAATRAVHAGRDDFSTLGVHAPPIDLSTTYPVVGVEAAAASLDQMAGGGRPVGTQAVYSRLYNPTVDRFEQALATLEGGAEAVAFASGMAALTATLMAARSDGRDHVVAVRPLYGGSDHLLDSEMLGLRTTWASADQVAEAIEPATALVVVETPANPTLHLVDIADVVRQAGPVPVLVDSTFATPVLQRPLEHGATWVLHSATKFLGGHGDVLAGVVATSDPESAARLRQVRVITGGVLHPLGAYLLHRGLPTLPVRIETAQRGARLLAERLADHPAVASVRYPGLAGQDPGGLIGRQMDGPGTLLAFELVSTRLDGDGFDEAAKVISSLDLITAAVSLGSVDSLIQHPAAMTHRVVSDAGRAEGGITPAMLRLSVGLEDPDDLWNDLAAALDAATGVASTPRASAAPTILEEIAAGG